jgi:regulator of protease activity HflC (stomatin/prohibitin superfamily)
VVGQSDLEDLLGHRDKVNEKLQNLIDEGTEPWGIKVSMVEVRDVELPDTMKRAMAAQAEAERERRAKIVHAEGEFQAAEKLAEAAKVISSEPQALQLRYLQTLVTVAAEKTNTIIFPLPLDLIKPFLERGNKEK